MIRNKSVRGQVLENWDELKKTIENVRESGRTIVFTNGVFDLIHPGHVDSLRRAKAEGGFLVVGINSDESVRRLKGQGRPILPQEQRMHVLAALEYVNLVTLFDQDTPKELIEAVRPHVLVKGGHYAIEEIVGHEFVQSYGGKVLSLPLREGYSSSSIIELIKQRFA